MITFIVIEQTATTRVKSHPIAFDLCEPNKLGRATAVELSWDGIFHPSHDAAIDAGWREFGNSDFNKRFQHWSSLRRKVSMVRVDEL